MARNASTASTWGGTSGEHTSRSTTGATIVVDDTNPPTLRNLHPLPSSCRLLASCDYHMQCRVVCSVHMHKLQEDGAQNMSQLFTSWSLGAAREAITKCSFCDRKAAPDNVLKFCDGWLPHKCLNRICRDSAIPQACRDQQGGPQKFSPECIRKLSTTRPSRPAPQSLPPSGGGVIKTRLPGTGLHHRALRHHPRGQ